ncbi:MAG: phytanoyl-CoA dioxygenase family protein, partial [Pseudomonadota bacterium]
MTPIRSQDRPQLDGSQVAQFEADGYLVLRGFLSQPRVAAMRQRALADLEADQGPLEREATVGYPGAPDSEAASGGSTVRRLLGAYDRDPAFTSFVEQPELAVMLRALLGSESVSFVRSHHNCVMTKQPRFSSDTGWHQDVRYWRFTNHNLVNAWLALTPESSPNGSLRVIPGTHRSEFSADRFDDALFLRPDHPENAALIERAV